MRGLNHNNVKCILQLLGKYCDIMYYKRRRRNAMQWNINLLCQHQEAINKELEMSCLAMDQGRVFWGALASCLQSHSSMWAGCKRQSKTLRTRNTKCFSNLSDHGNKWTYIRFRWDLISTPYWGHQGFPRALVFQNSQSLSTCLEPHNGLGSCNRALASWAAGARPAQWREKPSPPTNGFHCSQLSLETGKAVQSFPF